MAHRDSVLLSVLSIAVVIALVSPKKVWAQDASKELSVNLKTSRVYILVDKVRLGHAHGVEGNLKSGTLTLGAKSKAGQFVFDMETFNADTDAARKFVGLEGQTDEGTQKKVNENMLGPNGLDIKEFPTATFDIDSAMPTGKRSKDDHVLYELIGRFTLHGVTHPLSVFAEATTNDKGTKLIGQFKVLQTDFGIKPYSAGFGAIRVADSLTIWGELEFGK